MIDFVKFSVTDYSSEFLLENEQLEFDIKVRSTGEIHFRCASWHCLKFVLHESGRVEISGSLHKAYNSMMEIHAPNQLTEPERKKGFNGNDFSYRNLLFVLHSLSRNFGLRPNNLVLRNIEFGLNLIHDYNTGRILSNLIKHKGSPFLNPMKGFYQSEHGQYYVKCYNKADQYGMGEPIIRIELKYRKMEQLNRLGIFTAQDLLNKRCLKALHELLITKWGEVFLIDYTIRESQLNERDSNSMKSYKNPNFWLYELLPNHQHRPKKNYLRIERDHSDQVHYSLMRLLLLNGKQVLHTCPTLDRLFSTECVTVDHSTIRSSITPHL